MYEFFGNSLLLVLNVLYVAKCRQILSNNSDSAAERVVEDGKFIQPVIVNIELDKYGDNDVYIYRNIPANISVDSSEDLRRNKQNKCIGAHCPPTPPTRPPRPPTKDYPTMVHCRGILAYCRKECIELNTKMCGDWPYMCPGRTVSELPDRCKIQCIHNYRQMRLKFPNQPKLHRYVDPRYDRFDYE